MKPKLSLVFLFFGLLVFSSCGKKKPVACFALPIDRFEVGEQYAFKDCSVGASEYLYDFGDGNTSANASPTHTYNEPGDYNISLRVKGKKGEDELKRQVTVFNLDLTVFVVGTFEGKITETYPDSAILNRTYTSTVTVVRLNNKSATISFSRGAFDTQLAGTAENLTWNAINTPRPERLTNMKEGTGSYVKNTGKLAFTLTGSDPRYAEISWQIVFSGAQSK